MFIAIRKLSVYNIYSFIAFYYVHTVLCINTYIFFINIELESEVENIKSRSTNNTTNYSSGKGHNSDPSSTEKDENLTLNLLIQELRNDINKNKEQYYIDKNNYDITCKELHTQILRYKEPINRLESDLKLRPTLVSLCLYTIY